MLERGREELDDHANDDDDGPEKGGQPAAEDVPDPAEEQGRGITPPMALAALKKPRVDPVGCPNRSCHDSRTCMPFGHGL